MSSINIKQNIKASALDLFNSVGYEATSIRDLSAKAGCSLPMMYYYYKSKDKLLYEIVAVDFIQIMNGIFDKAVKTNDLRLFVNSFITDIVNLTGAAKQTVQIALKLHMGSPKNDELNKTILAYKFAKENALKNVLLPLWRADRNLEIKTHLTFDIIYQAIISVMLTNRPINIKQIEADIVFLL